MLALMQSWPQKLKHYQTEYKYNNNAYLHEKLAQPIQIPVQFLM